jgi:hypothetical protein
MKPACQNTKKGGGAYNGLWDHLDLYWDIGSADVLLQLDCGIACFLDRYRKNRRKK